MSSLFVYCPRLAVPLATFVMSLGRFRSMSARAVYLSFFLAYMWGLFVVTYMVKLARYGTPVLQPLPI